MTIAVLARASGGLQKGNGAPSRHGVAAARLIERMQTKHVVTF